MIKDKLKIAGWILLGAVPFITSTVVAISWHLKHPIVEYYEFNVSEVTETTEWKYDMLPCEMSNYICNLCEQIELDSDLVVAILLRENPELNPNAVHRNENGTSDTGLMQLNDKYTWLTFVPRYWHFEIEFNPFNWKENLYLGIHHIKYLSDNFKVMDDVIMAYNCGEGAVMNHTIPDLTYIYRAAVMNNYRLLQEANNGRERSKERE